LKSKPARPKTKATTQSQVMSSQVSAFKSFPVVKAAYIDARDRLRSIINERNCPELGLIDVPLWRFVHSCVPDGFPIPPLGKGAARIGMRCQGMILPLLDSGALDPGEYAASIRDPGRLDQFIETWVARDLGNRVIAIKRALHRSSINR
jgi:hypothetical protein